MNTKSYEECKQTLKKLDASTLERRIERCQELKGIQTDGLDLVIYERLTTFPYPQIPAYALAH